MRFLMNTAVVFMTALLTISSASAAPVSVPKTAQPKASAQAGTKTPPPKSAVPKTGTKTSPPKAASANETFQAVDLDRFIEQEKKASAKSVGKAIITMAKPISFQASMKRLPEAKRMTYIYTALELSGVRPIPEVGHQMFVETRGRRIIPVYVEKQAANKISHGLKDGNMTRFLGYHVYTYRKGPAILVTDFASVR